MSNTTIQISSETRQKLEAFKDYPRETYDEIIRKMVVIVKRISDEEGELSEDTLEDIRVAREQYAAGKGYSTKEVLKKLGI